MSELFKHKCIKPSCSNTYEDTDPEAYYCSSCNKERKIIAKQVDAKIAKTVSTKTLSFLQQYEAIQKKTGARFVNIKDLGITL